MIHPCLPSGLRTVNFRQNLLTDVSTWSSCSSRGVQEDIEFRDNQLKEVGKGRRGINERLGLVINLR